MKVRALKSFEGIRDNERTKIEGKDIYPKAGDEWEVSEERGLFLQKNGVVEIVETKEIVLEPITEISNESQRKPKEEKKSQRTKKSKK